MSFALVRSSADNAIGVALVPNIDAPPGVAQIDSVSDGHAMLEGSSPQTALNSGRYSAWEIRYAIQAVSDKPISCVSTGGCCACSASALCSLYPVERASQKFPLRRQLGLCCSGEQGNWVSTCIVALSACRR